MQKKKLIPTPLFDASLRKPVEIDADQTPRARRLLRVVAFVARTAWLWWRTSIELRFRGTANPREGARQIRMFMEDMGGMWIKAGQFMGMRRDLYTPETCDELSKLQDNAKGFPFAFVRRAIEEDLGAPIEEIFSEFSEAPVAAASIGQTHLARLRDGGVRVAVKVQRPHVATTFARDLKMLNGVARWLLRAGIGNQLRWDEMLWELRQILTEELDYRMEAAAIKSMRKQLRTHRVYAPKVFEKLSSRRVLVMEFIEGVFMSDYIKVASTDPGRIAAWAEENNIDPDKVGKRLYLMHLRQLYEFNQFHADLHPGNIVLQRDSRVALIDFGSVGSIDKSRHQKFRLMVTALADRDHEKFFEYMMLVQPPLPSDVDVAALKASCMRSLRAWAKRTTVKTLPYGEKCVSSIFAEVFQTMQQYGIASQWDFLNMTRADLTLDASIMFLSPGINYQKLVERYERESSQRAAEAALSSSSPLQAAGELAAAVKVPRAVGEQLLLEGEWVRRRAMRFEGRVGQFSSVFDSIFSLLQLGAVFAAAVAIGAYARKVVYAGRASQAAGSWSVLYDALPELGAPAWILIAGLALYLGTILARARRSIAKRVYDRPGVVSR